MWKKLGWKSITGAVVTAVSWAAEHSDVLPAKVAVWAQAAGYVLTVVGLRHAIAKGEGK